MVRGATELETHVVSVERVKEYSDLEQEVGGIQESQFETCDATNFVSSPAAPVVILKS